MYPSAYLRVLVFLRKYVGVNSQGVFSHFPSQSSLAILVRSIVS